MIMDSLLEFSKGQVVAASGLSTNVAKVFANGQPNPLVDLGVGEDTWFVVQLAKDNTATSGTLTVALQTSDVSAMTSPVTLVSSPQVDISTLKDGRIFAVRLPSAGYKDYLAVAYTGGAAGLAVDAFIVKDLQVNIPYESGSHIV